MITGYNTDVRHRGVVFHVQTEDKGLNNPCVESLVYVGGQIVGRKRSGYVQLIEEGKGKDEILELIERQHREMIAEIRAGKLDTQVSIEAAPAVAPETETEPAAPTSGAAEASEESGPSSTGPAAPAEESSPSLDQVILDYLNSEAEQEHLVLMMDSPGELRRGEEAMLAFHAKSSLAGAPVPSTSIVVTLISTASEPANLGKGLTDEQGNLTLRVVIPAISGGSAALIVTAKGQVGTAEIKHLV